MRTRRAALHRQADALIAEHSETSWRIARARAFDHGPGTPAFDEAWAVSTVLQRRLKIRHMPDTATRYLERRP